MGNHRTPTFRASAEQIKTNMETQIIQNRPDAIVSFLIRDNLCKYVAIHNGENS